MLLQICLSEVVKIVLKHTEQSILLSKVSHKDNFSNFTLLYSLAFRWLDFFFFFYWSTWSAENWKIPKQF